MRTSTPVYAAETRFSQERAVACVVSPVCTLFQPNRRPRIVWGAPSTFQALQPKRKIGKSNLPISTLLYPGIGRTQHIPAKGTARALDHAEHVRLGAHGRLDYLVQQDELVQGGDWNWSAPAANLSQRPAKESSPAKRLSFPWCRASQI